MCDGGVPRARTRASATRKRCSSTSRRSATASGGTSTWSRPPLLVLSPRPRAAAVAAAVAAAAAAARPTTPRASGSRGCSRSTCSRSTARYHRRLRAILPWQVERWLPHAGVRRHPKQRSRKQRGSAFLAACCSTPLYYLLPATNHAAGTAGPRHCKKKQDLAARRVRLDGFAEIDSGGARRPRWWLLREYEVPVRSNRAETVRLRQNGDENSCSR